jgi:hypothetical protein
VEALLNSDAIVRVLHAQRGGHSEELPLDDFVARREPYFACGGGIIDQALQSRLPDGMMQYYMRTDRRSQALDTN